MAYTNIDDPSAYFQATTYTGGGANTEVTNSGNSDLKPDFLWIKNRTAAYGHFVVDSNRNISYAQNSSNAPYLETESTAAENNNQNWMASVNTNGFTTGISEHINNNSGSAFVAWQWKANGGTTVTNTTGSIDSVVQANTDAGFSIVTWTGNENASATVGHGLGVTPELVMIKSRSGGYSWNVYLGALPQVSGNNMFMFLDTNSAAFQVAGTAFNSSTFQPTGNVKRNSGSMLAYCFAEKQGYSKFGKYVGNGSTDGTFVYLGFQPAFVMLKSSSIAVPWLMFDNKRDIANGDMDYLLASSNAAESNAGLGNSAPIDFLSNGFKLRNADAYANGANTYIYMAFAENPFVTSTGIPTTAR